MGRTTRTKSPLPSRDDGSPKTAIEPLGSDESGTTARSETSETEQRFAQMAEVIEQDFWLMSLHPLRLLYTSPAAKRLWGFDTAINAEHPERIAQCVYPDDLGVFAKLFGTLLSSSREGEYRIIRDGEVRWFRSRVFPVRDSAGDVYRIAGITEDITARKTAEQELLLYRTFDRLIATLSAGLVNVSSGSMAPAFCAALGDLAGVMGADGAAISLVDESASILRLTWHWRVAGRPSFRGLEFPLSVDQASSRLFTNLDVLQINSIEDMPDELRDDRERLRAIGSCSVVSVPLMSHGRVIGVLGFDSCVPRKAWPSDVAKLMKIAGEMFANAIERVRTEETMRAHRDRLAHVLRLGTMGQLASGIAHEINQPLSAILSYARGCERRLDALGIDLRDIRDALGNIGVQAMRAAEVIATLRALVKGESRREYKDLNMLVYDAFHLLRSESLEAGVNAQIAVSAEPLWVQADSVQIEQVILNLMRNAFEAMRSSTERELRVHTKRHARFAELAVADTGPGVSAAQTELVFGDFYTTKPHGLGLGLPISRSIVESHGGKLWLDGTVAKGACFRFTIPLSSPESVTDGR